MVFNAAGNDVRSEVALDGLDIRSEVPLEQIVAAVARFSKTRRSSEVTPRLSILLSGPSGCGKSEFVKYLGERAGKEVVVVTASDVLRALVGETEQRIADVFREAAEKNAILFLDEVDSLLYDRKSAHYGWERVQTNELLIQMERFTGVLVCATNLVEQLDAAVMRRFTFKVQMAALDDEGKVKFFSRYFKSELNADERRRLLSIPNLTPGDFRTVRERLFFLAGKNGADNARRIAALEVESAAKKDSRAHIGFA
jgi:SpoVK/Ycf46/Vps4 family AAA+-type ATPase